MRYAIYIDIEGDDRLDSLSEAIYSAVYELVNTERFPPLFSIDTHVVVPYTPVLTYKQGGLNAARKGMKL